MSRFDSLAGRTLDLLIVGGGIIGAGIARDAALRGLDVALFEQADFGGGTTAGSTRLVHGGLRYLEMLDFRLVRMDLRERETLLRIAPHLVKPLEFLVPWYGRSFFGRWRLRFGMFLYDLLSFDKSLPPRRWLSRDAVLAAEPHLAESHEAGPQMLAPARASASEAPRPAQPLQGAAAFYDAQVAMPERLCLENVLDACGHGALAFNHAEVIEALRGADDRVNGLRVRDVVSGETADVRGRLVINAAGPWVDRVARRLAPARGDRLRTTKGIHVACPRVIERALVLESPIDGRLFFAIPWLGYTWIGTTDTDYTEDPARVRATPEDVAYLMASVKAFLPELEPGQIFFSNAGVRALVKKGGAASAVSRLHEIADEARSGAPGIISVLGGKITGYRAIAEEATDRACDVLKVARPCRTAAELLPGARPARAAEAPHASVLAPETVAHLVALYGTRAGLVTQLTQERPALAARLTPASLDIEAQVIFSVRHEHCGRVDDFITRRTRLGFARDQGASAAPRVAALMAGELGWSNDRVTVELEAFRAHIARTQAFRSTAPAS